MRNGNSRKMEKNNAVKLFKKSGREIIEKRKKRKIIQKNK